jgi:UBA/TS-N domain
METLLAMGFEESAARVALHETAGNVEQAINALLQGSTTSASTSSFAPTAVAIPSGKVDDSSSIRTFYGNTSQYQVENGKSACTFMALSAARSFLQHPAIHNAADMASFLDEMVLRGSLLYQQWMQQQALSQTSQHTSPEEALQSGYFVDLCLREGGIRQGTLWPQHNWHALLSECQSSADWVCVVITKPPETVLVCLPPSSSSLSTSDRNETLCYYLMDSHPRPTLGNNANNNNAAYTRCHETLEQLIVSLQVLFPAVPLDGDDCGEVMAALYNSFDLYPLALTALKRLPYPDR